MRIRVGLGALFAVAVAGCEKPPARTAQTQMDSADTTRPVTRLPVEYWGRRLSSSSRSDQQGALGMLSQYGPEAAPYIAAIARHLESSSDSLGYTAAYALAHIGPEAKTTLVRALRNTSPRVRRRGVYGLGVMGDAASDNLPAITQMADADPAVEVRNMARWAVSQISDQGVISDPYLFLTYGLSDTALDTRIMAIRRLGASHPSNRVAVTQLIRLLGDSTEAIRNAAVDALVEKGSPAIPALTMALSHRRQLVRNGAMMALARLHRSL